MKEDFWEEFDTCFTEHLGKILNRNDEYKKAVEQERRLFDHFRDSLTDEQKSQLDEYYYAICDSVSLAEKIAYRHGAKDLMIYLFLDK